MTEIQEFAETAEEEAKKINQQSGASLVTDQEYWSKLDIHTGEDLARSLMISNYSDTYKSMHGIRPRWVRFEDMSFDEIQTMVEDLYEEEEEGGWDDEEGHEGWISDKEDDRRSAAQAELDAISAAHAEEEKMLTPEEGEDEPKRMGMGRRPLVGPARDVRRGRRISESNITSLSQIIREHQSKSTMTRKELRQIIRECLAAELTTK